MLGFDPLPNITMCDKLGDVRLHSIPPIFLPQIHIHLGSSGVDGICRVMGFVHDNVPEFPLPRHTNHVLNHKVSLSSTLKSGALFSPVCLRIFIKPWSEHWAFLISSSKVGWILNLRWDPWGMMCTFSCAISSYKWAFLGLSCLWGFRLKASATTLALPG